MRTHIIIALFVCVFSACGTRGPAALFKKQSPHEAYAQSLQSAGLQKSGLTRKWLASAQNSLLKPVSITLPYHETGFFDAAEPRAAAFRFAAKRGQQLTVTTQKRSIDSVKLFVDLWLNETSRSNFSKPLDFADTLNSPLTYNVDADGEYILRLQPELLQDLQYTLTLTTGPSLGFPVQKGANWNIGSYWGVDRDAGARRHEGIDIFAPKLTPAVAAAAGTVTAVNENYLGGLTVWMSPDGTNYTLYYAHLDKQIAVRGQKVMPGDTLGLIGNTGNARTTPPHLHFGIYTYGGAINPLPFVEQVRNRISAVHAPLLQLNKPVRIKPAKLNALSLTDDQPLTLYRHDLALVLSAERNNYRLLLADGRQVFASAQSVEILSPIRKTQYPADRPLLNHPGKNALQKKLVPAGTAVFVLAAYGEYFYVESEGETGWMSRG
ncbi:MAG: M23 family metallopeptidase [Mucilaginibacter polytrichastri]|nr:M23 family metallopeptidase [Mucilaginibacter polytrichastri]